MDLVQNLRSRFLLHWNASRSLLAKGVVFNQKSDTNLLTNLECLPSRKGTQDPRRELNAPNFWLHSIFPLVVNAMSYCLQINQAAFLSFIPVC